MMATAARDKARFPIAGEAETAALLAALRETAGPAWPECWAGDIELARASGLDPFLVRRTLRILAILGRIDLARRFAPKAGRTKPVVVRPPPRRKPGPDPAGPDILWSIRPHIAGWLAAGMTRAEAMEAAYRAACRAVAGGFPENFLPMIEMKVRRALEG